MEFSLLDTAGVDDQFQELSRRLSLAAGLDPASREDIHRRLLEYTRGRFSLPRVVERCGEQECDSETKPLCDRLTRLGFEVLDPLSGPKLAESTKLIDCLPSCRGYGETQRLISHEMIARYECFLQLMLDPEVLKKAADYFGIVPTIQTSFAWRNDYAVAPALNERGDYSWHFDLHGHLFLKYFVYLSTVSIDDGPHEFIPGTHRFHIGELGSNSQSLSDSTIEAIAAKLFAAESNRNKAITLLDKSIPDLVERKVQFVGPAGTRFLENTRGLHRGTPIRGYGRSRYVFQLLLTPYQSFNNDQSNKAFVDPQAVEELLSANFTKAELAKILDAAFVMAKK